MVTISRITTQKSNKNRYNIYIYNGKQEKYGFSIDEDLLIKHNLRKGLEISKEKMNQLMGQDEIHQSYNQVLRYLSYRMRSEKEVRTYLEKKEVIPEHIEQIVYKLTDQNFIDDQEFAKMFVRSRIKSSKKGPLLIKNELIDRGVSETYAIEALSIFFDDIQFKKATDIVKKRLQRSSKHSFQRQLDQSKAALQRNGYTNELIMDVIQQFHDHKDEQAEWNAIEHQGEKLFRRHRKKFVERELQQKVKEGLYRHGFSNDLIHKYLASQKKE